jgi:hypothetical protein
MNQNEIVASIRILNESFSSNFLKINNISINTEFIKKIIKKKKLEKQKNISSDKEEIINNTESDSSSVIDDSIAVTNFTIPSSIYKGSNTNSNTQTNTLTNTQTISTSISHNDKITSSTQKMQISN